MSEKIRLNLLAAIIILLGGLAAAGWAADTPAQFDPQTAPHYTMAFQGRDRLFYQDGGDDYLNVDPVTVDGIGLDYFRRNPLICFPARVQLVTDTILHLAAPERRVACSGRAEAAIGSLQKGDNIWIFGRIVFTKTKDQFEVAGLNVQRLPTDRDVFEKWKSTVVPGDQAGLIELGCKALQHGVETGRGETWTPFGTEVILEALAIKPGTMQSAEEYLGLAKMVYALVKDDATAARIAMFGWEQFPGDGTAAAFLIERGYEQYAGTWMTRDERYEREYADRWADAVPGDAAGMWTLKEWAEEHRDFLRDPEEKIVQCAQKVLALDPAHAEARKFLHADESGPAVARADDDAIPDSVRAPERELSFDADGIDRAYTGKYAGSAVFRKTLDAIPAVRNRAIAHVNDSCGFAYEDRNTICIRFDDDNGEWQRPGHTETRKTGWREVQLITVFMEHIVTGMDIEELLKHEFVHAIMLERMREAFTPLPTWLREGIAVWGSGELENRTAISVALAASDGDQPLEIINGLERIPHTASDYTEDGLFFEYLERTYSKEKVQKIINEIINGVHYRKAFEKVTGDPWDRIKESAFRFGRDYIKAGYSEEIDDYRQAYATFEQAQRYQRSKEFIAFRSALAGFDEVRKKYPRSYIGANAMYMQAQCCFITRDYENGLEWCRKAVADYPDYWAMAYLVKSLLVRSMIVYEKYDDAVRTGVELCRDYCYGSKDQQGLSYYYLGNAYSARKEYDRSLQCYTQALSLSRRITEDLIKEMERIEALWTEAGEKKKADEIRKLIEQYK